MTPRPSPAASTRPRVGWARWYALVPPRSTWRWLVGLVIAIGLTWSTAALAAPPDEAASSAGNAALTAAADAVLQTVDPNAPPASGAHTALRILVMMTALSLLPALVLTMTCFTRIIIVFSFLRQSLGIQGMPPNQVMMGMALFLTAFIMAPIGERMYADAFEPLSENRITVETAIDRAKEPLAEFMLQHTSDEDLRLFYDVSNRPRPKTRSDVSMLVLVPAFTMSEVRTAFQMGFLVLLPFLVVDLVISSVLMAMGMMMLPPTLIALPFKVMIFVLADGWGLVVKALVKSFHP